MFVKQNVGIRVCLHTMTTAVRIRTSQMIHTEYRYYLNALNATWHWCTSCTDTELLTLREEGEWSKNCAGSRTPKRLPYDRGLGLNFVAAYKAFFHLFNGRDV